MSTTGKVSATLSDADKTAVIAKLDEILALMPFLVTITKKESHDLHKMGSKSVEYANLGVSGATTFPAEMRSGFSTAEFQKDANLSGKLLEIQVKTNMVNEMVNDTLMAVGTDTMASADEVYDQLKKAAKKGNAPAKAVVDQMALRYKGQGKKKTPPTPAP